MSLESRLLQFPFVRHWQAIVLESSNVSLNCLFDISDSFLLGFPLTDATEQAGAFSNPVAIFTRINNHLSHRATSVPMCALDSIVCRRWSKIFFDKIEEFPLFSVR